MVNDNNRNNIINNLDNTTRTIINNYVITD